MRLAWYAFRGSWRRNWRATLVTALIGGLLGAVALGALAGARRTDSAYGRYLRAVRASDVLVDIPGPVLAAIRDVEHEPGTLSSAAWLGLDAQPVVHGRIDDSFLTDALAGSLDGEFFRQDKLTVLAGRLPAASSTNEVVLTPSMASAFHLAVGDRMTWQFYRAALIDGLPIGQTYPAQRISFLVAAIADRPPALSDQFDNAPFAILSPGATAPFVANEWGFGWVAMRLRGGDAGVPALRERLNRLATAFSQQLGVPVTITIRRMAIVQQEAQRAIEPQAVALGVLGGLAALAMLVLMGQGLAQLLGRSAADAPALRAMGASPLQTAAAVGSCGAAAVVGAEAVAIVGAIALSPLAPVGPVRGFDPITGVQADWLVLGGGGAALLVLQALSLVFVSWRTARPARQTGVARPSSAVVAASRAGLGVPAVTGIRHALDGRSGTRRVPVRATLAGSVMAITALVAALVFGASLSGLVAHPPDYGWNWTLLMQSEGGWGEFLPSTMNRLVASQPGVTGWSELGFAQLTIDGTEVPAMGLVQNAGLPVVPLTTSGHPLTGPDQIELGTLTMRQLGLHLGDRLRIGSDRRLLTVVGTVTLPSIGTQQTDHVSLGRGVMMRDSTLLTVLGLPQHASAEVMSVGDSVAGYLSTVAIDVSSLADARALAKRIAAANPDGTPGGTYRLGPQLGAPVVNASQMGSEPIALATGVAAAAVLALALTVLASVRERRRDLALLKALGLRARQVRALIAWQTSVILVIAAIAGVPLGIAAGRWAWTSFADAIGVVPATAIPLLSLLLGLAALLVGGNLLASVPARFAARIASAAILRAE